MRGILRTDPRVVGGPRRPLLEPARLRVRAILDPGADHGRVAGRIRSAIRDEVAPYLQTEVEFVDRLPMGPRAKFRMVEPLAILGLKPPWSVIDRPSIRMLPAEVGLNPRTSPAE